MGIGVFDTQQMSLGAHHSVTLRRGGWRGLFMQSCASFPLLPSVLICMVTAKPQFICRENAQKAQKH